MTKILLFQFCFNIIVLFLHYKKLVISLNFCYYITAYVALQSDDLFRSDGIYEINGFIRGSMTESDPRDHRDWNNVPSQALCDLLLTATIAYFLLNFLSLMSVQVVSTVNTLKTECDYFEFRVLQRSV